MIYNNSENEVAPNRTFSKIKTKIKAPGAIYQDWF